MMPTSADSLMSVYEGWDEDSHGNRYVQEDAILITTQADALVLGMQGIENFELGELGGHIIEPVKEDGRRRTDEDG